MHGIEQKLRERERELTLVYRLNEVLDQGQTDIDKVLAQCAEILPEGFQCPENTCARVRIGTSEYRSKNFSETRRLLSDAIYADSLLIGGVDIFCFYAEAPGDPAPFLPEERSLLKHVAKRIGIAFESRRTAERLRRSEARFRGITENSLSGIYIIENGLFTYVNQAFADIFRCDRIDLIGADPMLLIHPDDRRIVSRRMSDEYPVREVHYECKGIRKDRAVIHLEINGSSYHRDRRITLFGSVADITSRKELEQRNKYEVMRYHALLESTQDLIWIVDPVHFKIEACNSALVEHFMSFGIHAQVGMTPEEILPEDRAGSWRKMYQSAMSGPYHAEYPTLHGSKCLMLSFYPLVVEGEIRGISVFGHDVTELKEAERNLREEKERYRTVIESTDNAIFVVEPRRFDLIVCNAAFHRLMKEQYGIDVEPGMDLLDRLPPATAESWRGLLGKALSNGSLRTELRGQNARLFRLNFAVITTGEAVLGISVFSEDITEQAAYEAELKHINGELVMRLHQALRAISKIGEMRDAYTFGHQRHVQQLALAIAKEMELPPQTVDNIYFGSILHDIGKIYIPAEFLNKPGKLSELEYQIIQTHVRYGYEIAKEIDFPKEVPLMILQHHERLDGSGYPDGLTEGDILLESKILAVADVMEAMCTHRPYRPSLGKEAALREINDLMGVKYDCRVVEACTRLFREERFHPAR